MDNHDGGPQRRKEEGGRKGGEGGATRPVRGEEGRERERGEQCC